MIKSGVTLSPLAVYWQCLLAHSPNTLLYLWKICSGQLWSCSCVGLCEWMGTACLCGQGCVKGRETRLWDGIFVLWFLQSGMFVSVYSHRRRGWGWGWGWGLCILFSQTSSVYLSTLLCVLDAYGLSVQHTRHRWNTSFRQKLARAPLDFCCVN